MSEWFKGFIDSLERLIEKAPYLIFANRVREAIKQIAIYIRSYYDWLFIFAVLILLSYTAYLKWPLDNEDSQVLIFLVTAATLFFQAIIGTRAHEYRNRPIPEIEFHFDIPDCHVTKEGSGETGTPTYYIRMRVKNTGSSTLRDAAVTVENIKKNGSTWEKSMPLGLRWTDVEPNDPKPNPFGIPKNNIPMGSKRTVDFLKVRQDKKELNLCCVFPPNTRTHILETGSFELFISVDFANSHPIFAKFAVSYNGNWSDDKDIMFSKSTLDVRLEKQGTNRKDIFEETS